MPTYGYILAKPTIDTRDVVIRSRLLGDQKVYGCEPIDPERPEGLLELVKENHNLVGIDEAQFFSNKIIPVIQELLRRKKNVVVAGLDLDFRGEPFGPMPVILAIADEVTKLVASCEYVLEDSKVCGAIATRSQRLIDGKPANSVGAVVAVENSTPNLTYEARCLFHHEVPRD